MNTSGQLLLVGPGVYSDGSGIRLIPLQQVSSATVRMCLQIHQT